MAKQKRNRNRNRIKALFFLLLVCACAAAGGGYYYRERHIAEAAEEYIMTAGENQEILSGRITDMVGNEMTLSMTDQTREYQIPVGTDVKTKLGAVTTFSRLAAGDNIQMLVEKDGADGCILEIQIIE